MFVHDSDRVVGTRASLEQTEEKESESSCIPQSTAYLPTLVN